MRLWKSHEQGNDTKAHSLLFIFVLNLGSFFKILIPDAEVVPIFNFWDLDVTLCSQTYRNNTLKMTNKKTTVSFMEK